MCRNIKISDKTVKYYITKTGCWNVLPKAIGYPKISINGKSYPMSRAMIIFNIEKRELDSKEFVLHSCDNKSCINPVHLRIGTHQDNMRDKSKRHRALKLPYDDILWLRAVYSLLENSKKKEFLLEASRLFKVNIFVIKRYIFKKQ